MEKIYVMVTDDEIIIASSGSVARLLRSRVKAVQAAKAILISLSQQNLHNSALCTTIEMHELDITGGHHM